VQAKDGDAAVILCQTGRPGGILIDKKFNGGLTGPKAVDKIRRLHPDNGFSAVIVTNYPDGKDGADPEFDKHSQTEQALDYARQKFFVDIEQDVGEMVAVRCRPLLERLNQYEALFGGIEAYAVPAVRFVARVADIELADAPDGALIEYSTPEGTKQGKIVPKSRLAAVGAAFVGGQVDYQIYENGPVSLSRVVLTGKGIDDLTEDDFAPIDGE
jgi:hypothetical protein